MTPDQFRALALSLPGAVESSHMDHPDFRVGGRIFATLGYPNEEWGALSLPLGEQARVRKAEPEVFVLAAGAWGRAGATQVHLPLARKPSVRAALRAAWEERIAKNAAAKTKRDAAPKRRKPSKKA